MEVVASHSHLDTKAINSMATVGWTKAAPLSFLHNIITINIIIRVENITAIITEGTIINKTIAKQKVGVE